MESNRIFEMVSEGDEPMAQMASLLLPVSGVVLLVPQLAVAEVLSSDDLQLVELADNPYCYGTFNWREQNIPLLSFESIHNDKQPPLEKALKVVICNAVFAASATGFYAFVVSGVPRSLRLNEEVDLALDASKTDQQGVQMAASINGESVLIPDFEFIEKVVQEIVEKQ